MHSVKIVTFTMLVMLALAACSPITTIASSSGTQPTPVVNASSDLAPSQPPEWKTYQADSGFEIRYPLDTYSVHDVARPSLAAEKMVYPGAKIVEPNDAFVYQNGSAQTYRLTLAVIPNDQNWSLDAQREQLFTDNPIVQYSPNALVKHVIQEVNLDGVKALRVDDVTEGPLQLMTQIVAIHNGMLYYLLIEPHELPPNQAVAYAAKIANAANKALIDEVLASFKFIYK
ncbi:MAG TPA: hypothetical protein VMP08_19940 [Anaerolineae bacterium]|nr:hypothetical protein [Anaerolineae bacterium]